MFTRPTYFYRKSKMWVITLDREDERDKMIEKLRALPEIRYIICTNTSRRVKNRAYRFFVLFKISVNITNLRTETIHISDSFSDFDQNYKLAKSTGDVVYEWGEKPVVPETRTMTSDLLSKFKNPELLNETEKERYDASTNKHRVQPKDVVVRYIYGRHERNRIKYVSKFLCNVEHDNINYGRSVKWYGTGNECRGVCWYHNFIDLAVPCEDMLALCANESVFLKSRNVYIPNRYSEVWITSDESPYAQYVGDSLREEWLSSVNRMVLINLDNDPCA